VTNFGFVFGWFAQQRQDRRDALGLLHSHLMPAIRRAMRDPSEVVRGEHLACLAHICSRLPSQLPDLSSLHNETDTEADFYLNVSHIQLHRRIRALGRLEHALSSEQAFQRNNLTQLFLPLCMSMLLSASEKEHLLADQAVRALAALARRLDWPAYFAFLNRSLQLVAFLGFFFFCCLYCIHYF
jgi:U3 small nucleolar RNA-associated protein 20